MSKIARVWLGCALLVFAVIAAPSPSMTTVAAMQIDPCATLEPTLEPPTETATEVPTSTEDPTSTDVPTSTPDPTSTEIPTSTPDPTSTLEPTLFPDSVAGYQGQNLVGDSRSVVRFVQVAGVDPCETVTVEPTDEATLGPATEPPAEPTAEPTDEPVVQLPNTGSGGGGSSSIASLILVVGLASMAVWRIRRAVYTGR